MGLIIVLLVVLVIPSVSRALVSVDQYSEVEN